MLLKNFIFYIMSFRALISLKGIPLLCKNCVLDVRLLKQAWIIEVHCCAPVKCQVHFRCRSSTCSEGIGLYESRDGVVSLPCTWECLLWFAVPWQGKAFLLSRTGACTACDVPDFLLGKLWRLAKLTSAPPAQQPHHTISSSAPDELIWFQQPLKPSQQTWGAGKWRSGY